MPSKSIASPLHVLLGLTAVALLAAPAAADELGRQLAKVVKDNQESLCTVSFTVSIDNPWAGMMGGGRRGGGRGEGAAGGAGGRRRGGGGGGQAQSMAESVTGVIIDDSGHVLIARFEAPSMFGGAGGPAAPRDIKVKLRSGDEAEATYLGADPVTGFAVVKFDPAGLRLKPLRTGGSARIGLGDPVVVVGLLPEQMGGNPMFRLTRVNGQIDGAKESLVTQESVDDLMGCPAYSEAGDLIGFVGPFKSDEQADESGGFNMRGIMRMMQGRGSGELTARGVILPIERVRALLDDPGAVASAQAAPWHGLEVASVSSAYRALYGGLDEYPGCVNVKSVTSGSPAAAAGIEAGDVIIKVDGKQVDITGGGESGKFDALFAGKQAGEVVRMDGMREGESVEFSVELATAPLTWSQSPTHEDTSLGVTVRELTADYVRERRLPEGTQGVVVTAVTADGSAANAGLKTGDVLVTVGGQDVVSLGVWQRAAGTGLSLEVSYLRDGKTESASLSR